MRFINEVIETILICHNKGCHVLIKMLVGVFVFVLIEQIYDLVRINSVVKTVRYSNGFAIHIIAVITCPHRFFYILMWFLLQ